MSLTESRLTRTSAATGTGGPHAGHRDVGDVGAPRPRARRAPSCGWRGAWRAMGAGIAAAADVERRAPCGRPGVLVALAATVGLALGIAFGWVEWMVAGAVALILLVASVPFLFGARSYDVDLSLAHERVVAGDGRHRRDRGAQPRPRASRCPAASTSPSATGSSSSACRCCAPGHTIAQPLDIPALRRGIVTVGPGHDRAQRPARPPPPRARLRRRPRALRPPPHDGAAVHERGSHPRPRGQPDPAARRRRHVVPRHPRVRAGRLAAPDPLEVDRQDRAAHGPPVRGVPPLAHGGRARRRRSRVRRRRRVRARRRRAPRRSASGRCATRATSRSSPGREIPRVVRGRLRAITHIPVGSSPRPMLDGFSGVERLENTMPVAEVCRLTAESGEQLSIAFVVVGSRVSLTRLQQAALAFPADTTVVAVICDERAHPRMQPLSAPHRAHRRHARRPVGPPPAGSDVMSARCGMPRPAAGAGRWSSARVVAGSLFAAVVVVDRRDRRLADLPLVVVRAPRRRRRGRRRGDRRDRVAPALERLARRGRARRRLPRARRPARRALAARRHPPTCCAASASSTLRRAPRVEGPRHRRPAGRVVPQPARARRSWCSSSERARCSCCRGARTASRTRRCRSGIGMVSFGLFFGRTTVSAPLELGPVFLSAPVETALGLATLLADAAVARVAHARRARAARCSGRRRPAACACRACPRAPTAVAPRSAPAWSPSRSSSRSPSCPSPRAARSARCSRSRDRPRDRPRPPR